MTTIYAIFVCLHGTCHLWGAHGPPELWTYQTKQACEAKVARVAKDPRYEMVCMEADVPAWRPAR